MTDDAGCLNERLASSVADEISCLNERCDGWIMTNPSGLLDPSGLLASGLLVKELDSEF